MDIYEHAAGLRDEARDLQELARAFALTGNKHVANLLEEMAERLKVRVSHLLSDVETYHRKERERARAEAGGILKELLTRGAFQLAKE